MRSTKSAHFVGLLLACGSFADVPYPEDTSNNLAPSNPQPPPSSRTPERLAEARERRADDDALVHLARAEERRAKRRAKALKHRGAL